MAIANLFLKNSNVSRDALLKERGTEGEERYGAVQVSRRRTDRLTGENSVHLGEEVRGSTRVGGNGTKSGKEKESIFPDFCLAGDP